MDTTKEKIILFSRLRLSTTEGKVIRRIKIKLRKLKETLNPDNRHKTRYGEIGSNTIMER